MKCCQEKAVSSTAFYSLSQRNICSNSDEYDLHLYSFIQWLEFPMYPECIGMCITKLSIPMFFLQIYIFPSLAETFPQMWNRLDDDGKCKSKLEKNGLHFKVWQLNLRIGLGFRIFLLECLSERSEDCCYSSKFVFLLKTIALSLKLTRPICWKNSTIRLKLLMRLLRSRD